MKNPPDVTPSTVHIVRPTIGHRTTTQTIQTVTFIHRFRHITASHLQRNLGHRYLSTTRKHLTKLAAKNYVMRHPGRTISFCLTADGLAFLKQHVPTRAHRSLRSVRTDTTASTATRERHHVLADVYVHYKQHHNGYFEFFTGFDLQPLLCLPEATPDGFVRTNLPGQGMRYHFVEIYGWGRSTAAQRRRLESYIAFAESDQWEELTGEPRKPDLSIVVPSRAAENRLRAQLRRRLENSLVREFPICTAVVSDLGSDQADIWKTLTPFS